MRLLTHNFLACLKCETFPLAIAATDVEVVPVEFDAEFTRRMLARVDYSFLVAAYGSLLSAHRAALEKSEHFTSTPLPDSLDGADLADDSALLRQLHFVMNMVAVRNGELKCTACAQTYAIIEFIPDFVLEPGK